MQQGVVVSWSKETIADGLNGEAEIFPVGICVDEVSGKVCTVKVEDITITDYTIREKKDKQ